MTQPEVGKRYRISREVEVRRVLEYSPRIRVEDQEGLRFSISPYNWEELEPEYVEGGLYVSSLGNLWVRAKSVSGMPGWVRYTDYTPGSSLSFSAYIQPHDYPQRPLTRVYREEER